MIATIGLYLIDTLFVVWALALVALPFVTLTGLLLGKYSPAQARLVDLVAFGMAVGCAVFIVSTAAASRFIELQLTPLQGMVASVVVLCSLALSIPCALIAARLAVVARRNSSRNAASAPLG